MLATGVISIGIKSRITVPVQKLCASIKMYSLSSGSSSDSSSDSDSDTENVQKIERCKESGKIADAPTEIGRSVNSLIDKIAKKNNNTKMVDVAIPLKKSTAEKTYKKQNLSYETQLNKAVENVTNVLSGDRDKIKSQLLDRLSCLHESDTKTKEQYSLGNLNKLVRNMTVERQSGFLGKERSKYNIKSQNVKANIANKFMAQQDKKEQKYTVENTENKYQSTIRKQYRYQAEQNNLNQSLEFYSGDYTLFKNMKEPTTAIPELAMWNLLEKRELMLYSNQAPQNIFQEMIQWTESGKLWTFPIDNEYGMEKESNVHFSEHVFLESHLKDWCPKRGPVRHFMELVCIGLSKNPYMTVDEKIDHITWYKEYFKGKEEILKELGAIDVLPNTTEETKI